jgi:hypothetical protein
MSVEARGTLGLPVYPLGEAANAVAHMLGRHARGKVVIAV